MLKNQAVLCSCQAWFPEMPQSAAESRRNCRFEKSMFSGIHMSLMCGCLNLIGRIVNRKGLVGSTVDPPQLIKR